MGQPQLTSSRSARHAPRVARLARWLTLLALILSGAGPRPTALAQGIETVVVYYQTDASIPPAEICVGETTHIKVRFRRGVLFENGNPAEGRNVSEWQNSAWINGQVQTPAVGRLLANRQMVGFDGNAGSEVEFDFVAEAAGDATIRFMGEARPGEGDLIRYLDSYVDVKFKVKPCKLQLTTTSTWIVPGEAGLTIVAKIKRAELISDGPGQLGGQAEVKWYIRTTRVGTCPDAQYAGASTATLTAKIDGDQVAVEAIYATAKLDFNGVCLGESGATGSELVSVVPEVVNVTVPAAGGHENPDQVLAGPTRVPGKVDVWIIPVPQ